MNPKDIQIYIEGVREQDRRLLSKTITLIESSRPDHQELARKIVDQLLPQFPGLAKALSLRVSVCRWWIRAIGWRFWRWTPAAPEAVAA
jgi:hypothetical protein